MTSIRRFLRWLLPDQKGIQTVEFAFLLPIFLLLVFGIIDFGRAYLSWLNVTTGAREGARAAAVGKPTDVIVDRVQGAVTGLNITSVQTGFCSSAQGVLCITGINVGGAPGESVTVRVQYNFRFLTIPQIMALAGDSAFPGGVLPLAAETTMRLE